MNVCNEQGEIDMCMGIMMQKMIRIPGDVTILQYVNASFSHYRCYGLLNAQPYDSCILFAYCMHMCIYMYMYFALCFEKIKCQILLYILRNMSSFIVIYY